MSDLYHLFKDFTHKYHIHNYEISSLGLLKKLHIWAYNNQLIIKKKTMTGNSTIFMFDKLVKHFKLDVTELDV